MWLIYFSVLAASAVLRSLFGGKFLFQEFYKIIKTFSGVPIVYDLHVPEPRCQLG